MEITTNTPSTIHTTPVEYIVIQDARLYTPIPHINDDNADKKMMAGNAP